MLTSRTACSRAHFLILYLFLWSISIYAECTLVLLHSRRFKLISDISWNTSGGYQPRGSDAFSVTLCSQRCPWFPQFRTKLGQTTSLDEIEALLNVNVRRWRGLNVPTVSRGEKEDKEAMDEDSGMYAHDLSLRGFLDEGVSSDG